MKGLFFFSLFSQRQAPALGSNGEAGLRHPPELTGPAALGVLGGCPVYPASLASPVRAG